LSTPSGSAAALSGATSRQATLLPDVAGSYQLTLVVNDGRLDSAPAGHTLTVAAPSPIRVTIQTPRPAQLVGDSVPVVVTVTSTYEVRAVTATLAGGEATLVFAPDAWCVRDECYPGFAGTLSLAGKPPGNFTLAVLATDERGNDDQRSIGLVHDRPPNLTVTAPLDQSVALPTVPLDASCSDDIPGCVVELLLDGSLQQSSPSSLSGQLDLGNRVGHVVQVTLRARDSAGQVVGQVARVYVESPARLAVITEVPGPILDADERRLLFLQSESTGDRLAIFDRTTGQTEWIGMPEGRSVRQQSAYLTPSGAIFVTQSASGNVLTSRVYYWRAGTFTDLAYPESAGSLAVAGEYAIWNQGSELYRLNTTTGETTQVTVSAGNSYNAVTAQGTVVFWNRNYDIVRDQSGQQMVLTDDPSQWHLSPVADGDHVVYRRQNPCCPDPQQHAIVLIDGTSPLQLSAPRAAEPLPGRDYQVASGWVAYTDTGNLGQLHVFTRSPAGDLTRHTDLGTSSSINRVAGNGELMIINYGRRYFSRGGGLLEVSSEAGHSYFLGGAWYVVIGRALLAVDTAG
jgi:hypothetical protein